MVNIVYKKKGLKINAVWFCNDIDKLINMTNADIVFLHDVNFNKYKSSAIKKQYSLQTDLRMSSEEIFMSFSKNYRYEINRARKEDIKCIVYKSNDLENNIYLLNEFKKEYDDFVNLKKIKNAYNELAMNQYIKTNSVMLTKAFRNDINYAQHIYVCDEKNVRLLYSVSNFRTRGLDSNLIGRANKYLHFYDIEYFCKNGFEKYDWGGVHSKDASDGVDKFKREFGGDECSYYNILVGKSFVGKIAIKLIELNR